MKLSEQQQQQQQPQAELDDVVFEGKKKKKPSAKKAAAPAAADSAPTGSPTPSAGTEKKAPEEKDYDYTELLDRIFDLLNKGDQGAKTSKIPVPQLGRIGTKRTCITNFKELCNALHRPPEHLMAYLQVELGGLASIDGNAQQLVVKGRFQQAHIEKVIKHYIREYVICKVCKSYDTAMEKENRLNFVKCGSCNSRLSVAHIKQGFQAQVGKRKQQQ